jgi:hypothetical protein
MRLEPKRERLRLRRYCHDVFGPAEFVELLGLRRYFRNVRRHVRNTGMDM